MRFLRLFFFYGWVGALVLLGASGILTGAWELRQVYHLDLARVSPTDRADFLNQYRFLKSTELGVGVFCLFFRREIFRDRVFNRLFLFFLFLGVAARLLSIVLDGRPHWTFAGITAFELAAGIVLALQSHTLPEES